MKMLVSTAMVFLGTMLSALDFKDDWILAKEKDAIKVYTRTNENSPIKEFKAIATLDYAIAEIKEAILNFKSYSQWYDHCKSAQKIGNEDDQPIFYHMEVEMPFPFSNRDMVAAMIVEEHETEILIRISRQANLLEEKEDVVRMPVSSGGWRLTRLSHGHTKVEHWFMGDPAGNIPGGIVNMFLVAGPINTFNQLNEFLSSH